MPSKLKDICFDSADAAAVGQFWSDALGYPMKVHDEGQVSLTPDETGLPKFWFNPVAESKTSKNRVHIDITMPDNDEIDRLIALGASKLQEIRGDDGTLWWTVMADVEGNEFCAFPPR